MTREWIVIRNLAVGYEISCRRCGEKYVPALPCPVSLFIDISKSFGRAHAGCTEPRRLR